jgi:Ser/Thr protein kinase RdoA (MazF antagonist)
MTPAHLDERGPIVRVPSPSRAVGAIAWWGGGSAAIDADVLDEVLRRYGLRRAGVPRRLGSGRRNALVVVPTSEGRVVVKRYPARWAPDAIEHEHSILRHLASVAFRASRLRGTAAGGSVASVGGRRFAAFEHDRGRDLTRCLLTARQQRRVAWRLGTVLAELHRAADGFSPSGRHHLSLPPPDVARSAAPLVRTVERLALLPGPGGTAAASWRRLVERSSRIVLDLPDVRRRVVDAALPRTLVHADFGLHNVLFARDGSTVVHDFELAHVDHRLVDLVIVLSRSTDVAGRAFIDAYRASTAVAPAEWERLPDVWIDHRLSGAVRSWDTYVRHGDERRLRTALARIDEAERVARDGVEGWR